VGTFSHARHAGACSSNSLIYYTTATLATYLRHNYLALACNDLRNESARCLSVSRALCFCWPGRAAELAVGAVS
jgi:hypothetical protein